MFMRMVYDDQLAQVAYVIGCERTGEAIVVDPHRDVHQYVELAESNDLRVVAVAETHIHADYISGARELGERGARVYVSGEGGDNWASRWLDRRSGGGSYDHQLLRHGDVFSIGNIEFRVLHTPGHTPEHICFVVTDRGGGAEEPIGVLTGDFLFVGDLGRPDLLETAAGQIGERGPSARRLFASLRLLDELPDFTQVWPAHGAGSACGKSLGAVPTSAMGYERRMNTAMRAATTEDAFVEFILSGQPEPPLYFGRMKRENRDGPRLLSEAPTPRRLPASELLALDAHKAVIADTRPWDEFRVGHVPGSLSFPLIRSFCTDAGSMLRADEPNHLIVRQAELGEVLRRLARVGLESIAGWCDADELFAAADDLSTIEEIDVDEARSRLDRGEARLLDVRRAGEVAEESVADAINLTHTRLRAALDETPMDKPLICLCRTGKRSARAAALLARHGRRAINLRGGVHAWIESGAPIASS